jgi:hypothetical protein
LESLRQIIDFDVSTSGSLLLDASCYPNSEPIAASVSANVTFTIQRLNDFIVVQIRIGRFFHQTNFFDY